MDKTRPEAAAPDHSYLLDIARYTSIGPEGSREFGTEPPSPKEAESRWQGIASMFGGDGSHLTDEARDRILHACKTGENIGIGASSVRPEFYGLYPPATPLGGNSHG